MVLLVMCVGRAVGIAMVRFQFGYIFSGTYQEYGDVLQSGVVLLIEVLLWNLVILIWNIFFKNVF